MKADQFPDSGVRRMPPFVRPRLTPVLPLLLAMGLITGCSTTATKRFKDPDTASVILHYNSWDYIFMTKPPCYDGPFLHPIRRAELAGLFDSLHVPRETAVVSVCWDFDDDILDTILEGWKQELGDSGFHRAVFVHGKNDMQVKGTRIIEACQLTPAPSRLDKITLATPARAPAPAELATR